MIYQDKKVFEDLVQEIKEFTPKEATLWGLQIKVPLIFSLVLYFFQLFLIRDHYWLLKLWNFNTLMNVK